MSVRDLKDRVFRSPALRAALSVVSLLLAAVLTSAFVNEITTSHGVIWANWYRVKTFYFLGAFAVAQVVYQRSLYMFEVVIGRFGDAEYCMAYMRSQCLPEAAEKYRALIRQGDLGTLTQAMQEVKDILK